jgi:hypothetical protein
MDFAEVEVDYQFHSHIIGKSGANGKIGASGTRKHTNI